MAIIYTVFVVLLFFGMTIFVHELGHFVLARLCGMVVDVFAIGFGPALWKRKVRGTTYKIGALPFGGYVALPQMEPAGPDTAAAGAKAGKEPPAEEDAPRVLPPCAPWKKILVAAAGAAGNLLLAVLLAYLVFWIGKPSSPHERRCVIGYVEPASAAYAAGLRPGDTILRANGEAVANWQELITVLALTGRTHAVLETAAPGGPERESRLATEEGMMGLRLPPGLVMESLCRVGSLIRGGSAEAAGVKPGDLILEVNGRPVYSREHLIAMVSERADRDTPLAVRRGDKVLSLSVRPEMDAELGRPLIGIQFSQMAVDYDTVSHPRPSRQIREHASAIFRFLRALLTPRESRAAAGAVGGPVSILMMYWQMVQSSFMMALWFTVFLNVNLAILNLLPIPVLDGGHILFSLWELVTRRPVGPRVVGAFYKVFATLLIALFVFLTYRDARRIFDLFRRSEPPAAETTNAPPADASAP